MSNLLNSHSLAKILAGRIVFLVGMMGSGKSMTGPHLAKALKYSFVDQDKLIEEVSKVTISEIFAKDGENGFRDLETKTLKEIGKMHSLVVATGGGIVTRAENWGVLHQGIVVWIDPSRDCLLSRLKSDPNKRPLLTKNELANDLESLMNERYPFYAEADLQIPVDEESPEEVACEIMNKLSSKISDYGCQAEPQTIAE